MEDRNGISLHEPFYQDPKLILTITGRHQEERLKVTQLQDELSEFRPHRTPADQPTLQHDPSVDHGHLGLTNHGDVITIHRPSHKGPRARLVVHTIA